MATTVSLKPNAIDISGSTSGTTTLQATAVAGTTTLTLPAATDTLIGKATTDTLTNKTLTGAAMNGTLGATTPSTASVTTLTTSSTITHNGGTANGVAYLNGTNVLTMGSALTFDGTNLGVSGNANFGNSGSSNYGGYATGGRVFSLAAAGGVIPAISASTDTTASSTAIRAYTKETANDTSYAFDIQTGNGSGVTTQKLQLTWGANGLWNSAGLKLATNLGLGGTAPSSSGTGITFPATQSASTDANTLDDYEEGTWTPTDGSGAGRAFSNIGCSYVKIGRQVTVNAFFTVDISASTAAFRVNGLPFSSSASTQTIGTFNSSSGNAGTSFIPASTSYVNVATPSTYNTSLLNSQISNCGVAFTLTYFV